MKRRFVLCIVGLPFSVLLLTSLVGLTAQETTAQETTNSTATALPALASAGVISDARASYAKLPLSFEVNQGQKGACLAKPSKLTAHFGRTWKCHLPARCARLHSS
jgi:hypothetical protein